MNASILRGLVLLENASLAEVVQELCLQLVLRAASSVAIITGDKDHHSAHSMLGMGFVTVRPRLGPRKTTICGPDRWTLLTFTSPSC